MPLIHGYSRGTISANVRESIGAGEPPAQAVAIAFQVAREAYAARHPGRKTLPSYLRPGSMLERDVTGSSVTDKKLEIRTRHEVRPCGCRGEPAADAGLLVERAVYEAKGHRIDKLPLGHGFIVHPDHRWFGTLAEAKGWLAGHA